MIAPVVVWPRLFAGVDNAGYDLSSMTAPAAVACGGDAKAGTCCHHLEAALSWLQICCRRSGW